MLLNQNSRTAQRKPTVRTNAKSQKRFRSFIPVIIAGLALISAVAFSISVESRRARPDAARSNNEEPSKEKSHSVGSNPKKSSVSLAPITPFVPTVTATKADLLLVDNDLDTKADPGDTLKYTVVIGASGENATGVTFTDTVDPNTNFLGGTLAASPVGVNDTFPVTVTGNIRINSANLTTPFSVVANDYLGVNPVATISAFDATTANGGQIVMTTSGADIGKFTYNPPPGFEGVDTFTYTLSDNANATTAVANRTATVSITVSGMIWFINNNAAACLTLAAGCGRLTNPFSTLAAFHALNNGTGNNPAANDNIFVYESATDYVGPVTLLNGQKFIGQDATASLSTISGITPAVGSDPLPVTTPGAPIVNITSAGIGITVAQNNTLRGFTGGNATTDISGSGFGNLAISDVTLNGTGRTLDLTNGTLTATIASLSSTNSATTGISLTTVGGSLTSGSTTITNPTGIGISVNTSSATLNFANTSATGSGGTGVSLTTNTGAITFGSLGITPDANQKGLVATDNTQTITATSGTLSTSGAAAVEITRASSTTPLAISLTSVSTTGGPNGIVLTRTSGSFTVTGDGSTTGGLFDRDGSGGTIQSTTSHAVNLNTASNVTLRQMNIMNTAAGGACPGACTANGVNSVGGGGIVLSAVGLINLGGHGWYATNITGINSFDNNGRVQNWQTSNATGITVDNTNTNLTSFDVRNSVFTTSATGADGFLFDANGATSGTVNVISNEFTLIDQDAIQINNDGSGNLTAVVQKNNCHDSDATSGDGNNTLFLALSGSGNLNFTIGGPNAADGNTFTNTSRLQALAGIIQVNAAGGLTSIGALSGSIQNNTITNPAFNATRRGIMIAAEASAGNHGAHSINISNNSVQNLTLQGIYVSITSLNGWDILNGNYTINNNQVGNLGAIGTGGGDGGSAIEYETNPAAANTSTNFSANLLIQGNTAVSNNNSAVGTTLEINNRHTGGNNTSILNVTALGNSLTQSNAGGETFELLNSAGDGTGTGPSTCLDLNSANLPADRNNSIGGNGTHFKLTNNLGTFAIEGLGASTASAFLGPRNLSNGVAPATITTVGSFVNSAGCANSTALAVTAEATSEMQSDPAAPTSSVKPSTKQRAEEEIVYADTTQSADNYAPAVSPGALSAMAQAAIARWASFGISEEDLAKLRAISFEVADLPEAQLSSASSTRIVVDENAAGYGWFYDSSPDDDREFELQVLNRQLEALDSSLALGQMDLLTVLMRQLGSVIGSEKFQIEGQQSWFMQNTLVPGTRRLPQFKAREIGRAPATAAKVVAASRINNTQSSATVAKNEQVAKLDAGNSRGMTRRHHPLLRSAAASAPVSFADVMLNIGILPAGKSVTINFNATVNNPYLGATNQVSNQGTVSGSNFSNVLTDDPDVNVAFPDPTKTTIDQPDVTVAVTPSSVLEDGATNLVYTFTREGSTAAALTVNFTVGGTATFNTDYTQTGAATFAPPNGTVTIPIGSSTATVTLDPTADATVEPDETAILTVVSGASYDVGVPAAATGTITNDDTDVSVAVSPSAVDEDGAPNLVYTFTRVGVTSSPLTVNFTVSGTADPTNDYTQTGAATFVPPNATVNFLAGNSTATVTVDPTTDNLVEPNETVIFTLAAGTGYNVANPSAATGTINNDDAEVTLAVAPSVVQEDGATNLVYTFTRTGDIGDALTVNFTIGGTATFSTDYTQTGAATFVPPNGTVTFGAGNSTATVTIDPSADLTAEPDETVILTLAAGTGYNVGVPNTATGTIANDDTTVSVAVSPGAVNEDGATNLVYTFTRSDSSGALTVNFSIGGTATFNTDYTQTGAASFVPPNGTVTFADGSATATVTVDPSTDSTVEPDETVVLTVVAGAGYAVGAPSTATGTITNDDTDVSVAVAPLATTEDGATNLVYTFTRTGVTTGALSVNFTINGTATFNTDYTQTGATTFAPPNGTVDFAAGSSTATVTVDPTADNTVEPDETVILTVAAGTGYNVGAPSAATGTITNDDSTVSVAVSPSTVDEDGATNLVYTFTRAGSTTGALTVNFTIGGTATFSTDYTQSGAATFVPPNGTVTFGAGNATATVTVDPSADGTTEPDETVILTVVAGTGYEVGAPDSATGTINNDDNAVSVAVSPLATDEDGATNLVYTFTRGDSSGALTVNFSIGGTATFSTDYTQTGAATFTPPTGTVTFADGSLTATVTVDPSADLTVEPDETVILTVTAGAGYTVGAPASATGTITNDDTDVSVAVSPLSTAEDGAGNLVYTFTRTGVTTGALTVNFSVGGTANASNDYTQTGATTFTPPTGIVTFVAGSSTATVTVDPTADGAAEADETVILTVVSGTGYNVGAPSAATGTITNDDTEVSVAVSPSSVLEDGATNMVYTFTRVGLTSGALTVNFQVSGTAVFAPPGGDYFATGADTFVNAGPGTVTFLAGSSTATVTVDPLGDADLEPDETVILTVTAGAGYTVGSPNSATGTILNDDNSPPTVVVGYGQCGSGATTGTLNLLVGDVETPAGSLILSATSSNTAVVPLANISFGGSGANRTVTINAVTQATVGFSDVTITVTDGNGLMSSINIRVIVGTNKTETINIGTTTVGSDMIFGGNGDDTINAGAGNDLVCGGNSGGIINGGLGDDTLDGGNGNDTLRGGDGNDLLLGGNGADVLEGGNNDDTLTGGSGPDSFNGGPGNDTATDFNVGQGDTKVDVIEIGALFKVEDKNSVFVAASGVDWKKGVFAYVVSEVPWWISAILAAAV